MNETDDHQTGEGESENVSNNNKSDIQKRFDDKQDSNESRAELKEAITTAYHARRQGKDPDSAIEISFAEEMPERVENILGISGVADRIHELESDYTREEVALKFAKDIAEGQIGNYDDKTAKIEGAVRTAVALLTEGIAAAPVEGIERVEILKNDDGTEFVNVYYAEPIRLANSAAKALSVLVADYTRSLLGLAEYKAHQDEIERYVEEISLYDSENSLQFSPGDTVNRFIATNMPIMLDGEANSDEEISEYRDLDRVDTNTVRIGMCLVAAEGIALKAPKIQRYARQLDEVEWPWLETLLSGTIGKNSDGTMS